MTEIDNDVINRLKNEAEMLFGTGVGNPNSLISLRGDIINNKRWKGLMKSLRYKTQEPSGKSQMLLIHRDLLKYAIEQVCKLGLVPSCKANDNKPTCRAFGSTNDTSDIDMTISGSCFSTNLATLRNIKELIKETYGKFQFFYVKDAFSFKSFFEFFDINFYLSDFLVPKPSITDSVVGNNVNGNKFIKMQDLMVAYDGMQIKLSFLNNRDMNEANYEKAVNALNCILDRNDYNMKVSDDDINQIINFLSILALYEDECYVTQGAFLHVVIMNQRKIDIQLDGSAGEYLRMKLLLLCSLIENVKFAISHASNESRVKYLIRVQDAIERFNKIEEEELKNTNRTKNVSKDVIEEVINDIKSVFNTEGGIKQLVGNLIVEILETKGDDNRIVEDGKILLDKINSELLKKTSPLPSISNSNSNSNSFIEKSLSVLTASDIDACGSLPKVNTVPNVNAVPTSNAKSNANSKQIFSIRRKQTSLLSEVYDKTQSNSNINTFATNAFGRDTILAESPPPQSMLAQGGGMKLKRCLTKDKVQLKKQIAGKMRLIYTDDKRHQYVKMNGAFVALRQIKA